MRVGQSAPSAAVVEAAAAADAEANSVSVLVEVHRARPRAFRTNLLSVIVFVVAAACPADITHVDQYPVGGESTAVRTSEYRPLLTSCFCPLCVSSSAARVQRCNSRASAVEPPEGKRVAAHGASRRELSGGPGVGGAVRVFLLPQAGEGAQPRCQREWCVGINNQYFCFLARVILYHHHLCRASPLVRHTFI